MCSELIGDANTSTVLIERGGWGGALLDSGPMISTISQSLCERLGLEVKALGELIRVEGAGGHNLDYSSYVEAEMKIPNPYNAVFYALYLVVPDTFYNSNVPVLIGTNILKWWLQHISREIPVVMVPQLVKHGKLLCIVCAMVLLKLKPQKRSLCHLILER